MEKLISWVEIPAVDFDRAVDFYGKLFNIKFEVLNCDEEKMACFPSGEGAISFAPGFQPSKDGLLVSFNAGTDLKAVLDKIKQLGGKIVRPKTKIEAEGRGYFAIAIDCEGNKIGLYQD
ncbi:MAG: VOC family protein [Chloroflexia bacterium]|nr:VOC family protein [Chloroflexia bacterium]